MDFMLIYNENNLARNKPVRKYNCQSQNTDCVNVSCQITAQFPY